MASRKIMEITACGVHLKGYYEEGKVNPWRLYKMEWKPRKDGCGLSHSKTMLDKWANFNSMMYYLRDYFDGNAAAWQD